MAVTTTKLSAVVVLQPSLGELKVTKLSAVVILKPGAVTTRQQVIVVT